MGYLGYIVSNSNNDNCEPQQFLNASEVSYFIESDDLMTADRVAYIIHPALTKVIEKKFNKSFMHFSGFILGKGLSVESEIISKMVEDRKNLITMLFYLNIIINHSVNQRNCLFTYLK